MTTPEVGERSGAGEARGGRSDVATGVALGLFFGITVVARHRLGAQWGAVAQWLPLVPTLAVAAWEHRLARRGPRARRVVWAGLAATIPSVLVGLVVLRSVDGPAVEAVVVTLVALPLAVTGLVLRSH